MKKAKLIIENDADISVSLTRTMGNQLIYTLQLFNSFDDYQDSSVQEIRRSFKKCRAILRLIRDSIGFAAYYRENRNFRDFQRLLSEVRDKSVLYKILIDFQEKYPDKTQGLWWKRIIENAGKERDAEYTRFLSSDALDQIKQGTQIVFNRINYYQISGNGFVFFQKGLMRSYKQGKQMMIKAYETGSNPQEIHDFRKKAKYLQYQLAVLQEIFPELLKSTVNAFKKLTNSLGTYNDLYNVRLKLYALLKGNKRDMKRIEQIFKMFDEEMSEIMEYSEKLAKKIFAEETNQFISRFKIYWEVSTANQDTMCK